MKIIFDWSRDLDENKTHWRGDMEIISLEISQRECSFASAKVRLFSKSTDVLIDKKYAKIGVQTSENDPKIDLLFYGKLTSFPLGFGDSCIWLEFIAEPSDYQRQLNTFFRKNMEAYKSVDLHSPLTSFVPFDDLFFSSKDTNNPTVFLENDCAFFYWDMRTGKLSISDINVGKRNFSITGDEILHNSLRVRLAREPYKNINVGLEASWIQRSGGYVDLFPMIAKSFRNGIVSSFTNIKSSIENLRGFSNKSGYQLLYSKINEVIPSVTTRGQFPLVSRNFAINRDNKTLNLRFRRFYFDGSIIVNWNHRQKKTEVVNVKIVNTGIPCGREKTISLKLNSIQLQKKYPLWEPFTRYKSGEKALRDGYVLECVADHVSENAIDVSKWKKIEKIPDALQDDSCGSFFGTTRGKNAVRYAIQKAIALIKYSSRHIEVSFSTEVKNFLFATVDDQVSINDPRFPNGKITGKIIKTKFVGNADRKIMEITIACSVNNFAGVSIEKMNSYFNELSIEPDESAIKPENIVSEVNVKNPPEEQEEILSRMNAETALELERRLRKHKTKITIYMHPLNTSYIIRRDAHLPDFEI
jgi:hypothetical protein